MTKLARATCHRRQWRVSHRGFGGRSARAGLALCDRGRALLDADAAEHDAARSFADGLMEIGAEVERGTGFRRIVGISLLKGGGETHLQRAGIDQRLTLQ